ncbi:MAG: DUF4350 domain-containing protein [Gammaproteobacteria bacterium]
MKERLMTLLAALAALGLSIFLLAPPLVRQAPPVSLPTSEDRGSDGLKGLYTWLQGERLPVASLRRRYTDLHRYTATAEQGNVLIVSLPAAKEVLEREWQALHAWVAKGNTLLVLGAVYYRPAWAHGEDCFCEVKKFLRQFAWSLAAQTQAGAAKERKDYAGKNLQEKLAALRADVKAHMAEQDRLSAVSGHPVLHGVAQIETQTTPALLKERWSLTSKARDNLAWRLLMFADRKETAAVWQIKAGAGQVFLSLTPDLFSNGRLNHADNARFFGNLLSQALAAGGTLLFDDYHFGLSELYDPERFFADDRLHRTLGCLGLIWMLYVIGYSNRLAPVRAINAKVSLGDFIDATAGFFARRLHRRILAGELVRHLLTDLRHQRRLRDDEDAWRWLERHPQITSGQMALLKQASLKRRVSLARLTDTITHIRITLL